MLMVSYCDHLLSSVFCQSVVCPHHLLCDNQLINLDKTLQKPSSQCPYHNSFNIFCYSFRILVSIMQLKKYSPPNRLVNFHIILYEFSLREPFKLLPCYLVKKKWPLGRRRLFYLYNGYC